ncbi:MAG: circadian clock protein KaiB [Candidatus Entotheonella factor]|uniref:Circadian clock protein KaiB n=1 Tax=Entotheonella factor TaxID=1429438 RepID=W4LL99_ENTF1|nr:MAG: circadian clock protein KaiB [Candidatus Entotheonella factor]
MVHLYVMGEHTFSRESVLTVRQLCEGEFQAWYELTTIDLKTSPERAGVPPILVTPTLVRIHPAPERRCIGDLSDANAMRCVLQSWLEDAECCDPC